MNSKDKQRAYNHDVDEFCEIINKAFAYPFMPKEFVQVSPSPYPNGIRLQIGSRDLSFTLDGEFMGQGTNLPEEWTITQNKSAKKICAASDCDTEFIPRTTGGHPQLFCCKRCCWREVKRRQRKENA